MKRYTNSVRSESCSVLLLYLCMIFGICSTLTGINSPHWKQHHSGSSNLHVACGCFRLDTGCRYSVHGDAQNNRYSLLIPQNDRDECLLYRSNQQFIIYTMACIIICAVLLCTLVSSHTATEHGRHNGVFKRLCELALFAFQGLGALFGIVGLALFSTLIKTETTNDSDFSAGFQLFCFAYVLFLVSIYVNASSRVLKDCNIGCVTLTNNVAVLLCLVCAFTMSSMLTQTTWGSLNVGPNHIHVHRLDLMINQTLKNIGLREEDTNIDQFLHLINHVNGSANAGVAVSSINNTDQGGQRLILTSSGSNAFRMGVSDFCFCEPILPGCEWAGTVFLDKDKCTMFQIVQFLAYTTLIVQLIAFAWAYTSRAHTLISNVVLIAMDIIVLMAGYGAYGIYTSKSMLWGNVTHKVAVGEGIDMFVSGVNIFCLSSFISILSLLARKRPINTNYEVLGNNNQPLHPRGGKSNGMQKKQEKAVKDIENDNDDDSEDEIIDLQPNQKKSSNDNEDSVDL